MLDDIAAFVTDASGGEPDEAAWRTSDAAVPTLDSAGMTPAANFVLPFCSVLVRNFASTRFKFWVLGVGTFALARPLLLFVFADTFARGDARFATLARFLFEPRAADVALELFRASFEEAGFGFGLLAALVRLAAERRLTAFPGLALTVDVGLCLAVAVAPVFFVDFLRAAIGIISTPDRATTPH